MTPASSDRVLTLHRGFAELPEPTRAFSPRRDAAHIDLPLDGPRAEPVYACLTGARPERLFPRDARRFVAIPFPDKAKVDSEHAQRMHSERQLELTRAAHAAGHDSGLVAGYWRGARHGVLAGIVLGAILGGLVIGLRAGLLP